MKENLRIAPGKNIYFKDNLIPLSQNVSFTKVSKNNYKSIKVIISNNSIIRLMKYLISKAISMNIINNSTLFVEGKINFENDKQSFTEIFSEDGTGSLIFINNNYNFKNINISNLSAISIISYFMEELIL